MPYRICKSLEVENAHMLSKHPDNCQYPHGHSRRIEFIIESDKLDDNDMVCDFKIIKETVFDYIMSFDHAICLNSDDPNYEYFSKNFGDRVIRYESKDPTTEVIAKEIFDYCNKKLMEYSSNPDSKYPLTNNVRLVKVRVWETSSSWAEYEPEG